MTSEGDKPGGKPGKKPQDLLSKAREFLDSEGFPFELECAKTLTEAGLSVGQNGYYLDSYSAAGKPREIDLRAWKIDLRSEPSKFFVATMNAIECKVIKRAPWIGFREVDSGTYTDDIMTSLLIQSQFLLDDAHGVALSELLQGTPLPLLDGFGHVVHTGVVPMRFKGKGRSAEDEEEEEGQNEADDGWAPEGGEGKTKDHAFESMVKVLRVAAIELETARESSAGFDVLFVSMPVIMVDGALLSCRLGTDGKPDVEKVDRLLLATSGFFPGKHSQRYLVPIVSKKVLPDFARSLVRTHDLIAEVAFSNRDRFARPVQAPKGRPKKR